MVARTERSRRGSRATVAVVAAMSFAGARAAPTSIGSEGFTVPPFKCFGTSAVLKYDMTVVASDLSGITWNPETETLFAVNNGDRIIYELTYPNTLVKSYDVAATSADLEGISAMGNRKFAFTTENPATVYTATLNADGTVTNNVTIKAGLPSGSAAGNNLGFEGVVYMPGDKFYTVQEANPSKIWSHPLTAGGDYTALTGDLKLAFPQIASVGGMTRGGDATDELFLVVKNYNATGRGGEVYNGQKSIWRYNITSGTFTERFGGEVCTMGQPEGLTFWKNATSGKIMMLVVGETNEARVYQADPTCTDALNTTSELMSTCAKVKVSESNCERTKAEGGCPWTRCDKDLTTHTKICTDVTPGVTDCTEAECMQKCNSSAFSGSNVGQTCTHWAYDVAEKECYIFAGCTNAKFDKDYTTYTMQDKTCERTIEDYPLGCEQRRCDKDISKHDKICTKKTPGTTDCTLAECKAKCQQHTDFTCTTYAYDVAEKECYLFETCENEKHDDDYSTYVLIDPTCGKNKTAGGCNQRRCDKDLTTHEKVCVDDTPAQQCSEAMCEYKCANHTFTSINSEAYCTHWAYDVADKECYVFYGCTGEKYDDDYTLYTQSYGERLALRAAGAPTPPPPPATPPKSAAGLHRLFVTAFIALAALLVA